MVLACPIEKNPEYDKQLQALKDHYKDIDYPDAVWKAYLTVYRNNEDLPIDWMPTSDEDYYGFTNYINKPVDNSHSTTVTKEYLDSMYNTMVGMYPSQQMLNNRLTMVSIMFRNVVDKIVAQNPGMSREEAINSKASGSRHGFQVIMDEVFSAIDKCSTVEGQIEWHKSIDSKVDDAYVDKYRWVYERRAKEYKKLYDNKEAVAGLVAPMIGATEGISISMDGLTFNFNEEQDPYDDDYEDAEDDSIDSGEADKGERFVDFRTFSLMSSLSTEAKQLISRMWQMKANGKYATDDLGNRLPMSIRQTAIILHNVLRYSNPKNMMSDIKKAIPQYPSLRYLYAYLMKNPDDQTTIYCNFKKAKSKYYSGYKKKNGELNVASANNKADSKTMSREAGSNLASGACGAEEFSIVNPDGTLKELDFYKNATADEYRFNSYKNLRAIGFNVTEDDINSLRDSYSQVIVEKSTNPLQGDTTQWNMVVSRLDSLIYYIWDKAQGIILLNDDLTGSHLYNYAQEYYDEIAEILSPLQKEEAEERVISNNKSLSVNTNPNALHRLVDILSNPRGLSEEDYKAMVMREFGQFEGMSLGFGNDMKLTGWLETATTDWRNRVRQGRDPEGYQARNREIQEQRNREPEFAPKDFDLIDLADSMRTTYAKLTDDQHAITSFVMFQKGGRGRIDTHRGRMYEVPIQSDYESAYNFISAPEYTRDQLVEKLSQEIECELQRIAAIRERKEADNRKQTKELTRPTDKLYEERGLFIQTFPEMNYNGFFEEYSRTNPAQAHELVKRYVDDQLKRLLEREQQKLVDFGMFTTDNIKLHGANSVKDKNITSWILNSFYARQQLTKLMYGGLEHFKDTADFEKRNMYSHATSIPLYTNATYKDEPVGKENQRVLYLDDDNIKSQIYDKIVNIADRLVSEKKITPDQAKAMKKAYAKIKTTDGQGIRTLDSMRAVKIMANLWTDEDEQAYKNIKSNKYGPSDVEHFMVGLKPIYTGYETLPAQPGMYQKPIRIPVLHKYSEMVLLPEMMDAVSLQNDAVPFKAMNEINKKLGKGNEIDLFLFGSDVKVGGHSLIDAFAAEDGERILKDADSISDYVIEKINSGSFWVHTLPFRYYGIAAATHADVEDKNIAWSSQAEKEAWGNIKPKQADDSQNEKITVRDKKMNAWDARELYNRIKAARVIDAFQGLKDIFYSNRKTSKLLKDELSGRTYQSRDLMFALQTLDCNRGYQLPLFMPNLQHDTMTMMSSILRKRLTRIPTKGANIIQTTSFGLDAKSFSTEDLPEGFPPLGIKINENGKSYVEVYMPIHDSRLHIFADENGNITPQRLQELIDTGAIPESVLEFIAYRTPSDAEHSVIPCRIKGFLANASGPSIRLPREVMVMTGHDYDGDKLRCHFKDFRLKWDEKKIQREYEKFSGQEVTMAILDESSDATPTPYSLFRKNLISDTNPDANKYLLGVEEIQYDYDKTPLQNIGSNSDYRALNNALVELMFAQLTSENGFMKMFIPGGNEETTTYAHTMQIMRAYDSEQGREGIYRGLLQNKVSDQDARDILSSPNKLYNKLVNSDSDFLEAIIQQVDSSNSPFAVTHATESHRYMMDGAGMIGVYAIYNSAYVMFQRLNLQYEPSENSKKEKVRIKMFDKEFGKLFPVTKDGAFASLGLARLINAAVDNGKNPLLGHLNQTAELAPLTNLLFAAGLSEEEVHLVMNQPVMIELAKRMRKPNAPSFKDCADAISAELRGVKPNEKVKTIPAKQSADYVAGMNKPSFVEALPLKYKNIEATSTVAQKQVHILNLMSHLHTAASDLDMFTKLTRPEANSGGIGATVGDTIAMVMQLDKFRERLDPSNPDRTRISGMEGVLEYRRIYENIMTPAMIDKTLGNELPEVVALNSMLKDHSLKMFSEWYPHTRESWLRVIKRVAGQYTFDRVPGTVVTRIANDMILWKLLNSTSFVTGNPQEEQKRILEETPEKLAQLKERVFNATKNPGTDKLGEELASNMFLNNLDLGNTINGNNDTVKRIRFRQNGPTVENTADAIRFDWHRLWAHPETKELAEDLFKYNLYTNGFSYGRYEFSHYAPFTVYYNIKGYAEALRDIMRSNWDDDEMENFYHQYCMNHWGDKNFVVKLKSKDIPASVAKDLGVDVPKNPSTMELFFGKVGNSDYIVVPGKERRERYVPEQTKYIKYRTDYDTTDWKKEIVPAHKEEGMVDVDNLYRVHRDSEGQIIGFEKAEKLGIRNDSNQVMVQYNPRVRDYREVKPYFISNDVAWENKRSLSAEENKASVATANAQRTLQDAIDDIPFGIPIQPKTVKQIDMSAIRPVDDSGKLSPELSAALGFEDELPVESKSNSGETINIYYGTGENANLSNFAHRPFTVDSKLDGAIARAINFSSIYGEDLTFQSVEQAFQLAKAAFSSELTDGPDANSIDRLTERILKASPSEAKRIGRKIPLTKEEAELWDKHSSFIMKSLIQASFDQNPDAAQDLVNTGNAVLTHTQDKGKWGTEFPRILMEVRANLQNQAFYLIQKDENGNVRMPSYADSPNAVRRARAQKAFRLLDERLREILRKRGVDVGVLDNAEKLMEAGGVSDFRTAHVIAEGMKELIRVSNDIVGEWALPEEFAHVSLEMLGKRSVDKDDDGNVTEFHHGNKLVERLFNALNTNNKALEDAYDGMLGDYETKYGNDREKLVVEAAGKLVAKHLFLQQKLESSPLRSLVHRVCEAIKNFFKRFSVQEINEAMFDADNIASQLARDLLSGKLDDELKLENITSTDVYYNLKEDLSGKEDILSKLKKNTAKRIDTLRKRLKYSLRAGNTSSDALSSAQSQLDTLSVDLNKVKLEETVVKYLKDIMDFMSRMEKSLDDTIGNRSANSACKKLCIVKDNLFSFAAALEDIKESINNGELEDTVDLSSSVDAVSKQMEKFWSKYHKIGQLYFEKFLSNVYGEEGVKVTVGPNKNRIITIHEMATKADHDISTMSRLLHAVSDIDDYVLQAIDDVTRDAKMNARAKVRELRPRLEAAMAALVKEQGNRDQSWMFKRKGGKRIGKYINLADSRKLSPARKQFYDVFMELKRLADSCLPGGMTQLENMIMFRKEHYEKMKEAQSIRGKATEEWEAAKRSVLEMGDVDFENEVVNTDFADNKVDMLPVKFLNKGKNETYDDMTEDAASSLMAYLGMAFEYRAMDNVIGLLENARYMSSRRDVQQKKGIRQRIVDITTGENGIGYKEPYTVKQARTNIQKAMDDFFQMHVYGHLQKDEGTIGKTRVSKRKLANTLNRFSSLSQMAINLHQRIANINTGFTQILVESTGGKIKAKDVAWASAIWTKESADRLAETGKTDYSNKLSLWMDKFDIHQDNGREVQQTKYGRSRSSRVFNEGLLYAGLSIGEDFLAGTTALALARQVKLKGPNGEDSNIWDAYEVKYVDEQNKTGAYLTLKEGYTKEDGSLLTFEDEKKFTKRVIGTNFELQGIYNTDDRSAIQQHALGALAIMYRKWIAPAWKRRYSGVQYSALKGDFQEGYYRTAARLVSDSVKDWFAPVSDEESEKTILDILTDIRALSTSISMNWQNMSEYEKGNVRKSLTELAVVFALFAGSILLTKLPPDDHDGNKFLCWADDIAVTQLLRLRSEIGSQAPTPNLVNEALRIASSPFAALRPLRDSLNIFQLMWVPNYFEIVQSGKYKGRTKAHRYFMKLPVISMFRKFDNFVDPSDLINYYKNQNY